MTVTPIKQAPADLRLTLRICLLSGCAILSILGLAMASDSDDFGSFYFISWAFVWGLMGSHTGLDIPCLTVLANTEAAR